MIFGRAGRSLDLSVEFHAAARSLVVAGGGRGSGAARAHTQVVAPQGFPAQVFVTVTEGEDRAVAVRWAGGSLRPDWLTAANLAAREVWAKGVVIWHERPQMAIDHLSYWRLLKRRSGYPADIPELDTAGDPSTLRRGLSFIIRAKNEAGNVGPCLSSIAGLADEIIFVDNCSTDETLRLAAAQQKRIFDLKTFSYPHPVPPVGEPHAAALRAQNPHTLGRFYNWCLAQSTRCNFLKWDADYIALRENLTEMIERYDLRLRGDPFVLWFSGLELFSDGKRHWVDRHSLHSEFRGFSRKHGHCWVDIPQWEEIDQAALFMSQKLFFNKPVYVEVFRLDRPEFADRGTHAGDPRDKARLKYVADFQRRGVVPASFMPVEGPHDKRLAGLPLSPAEIELAALSDRRLRAAPAIRHRASSQHLDFGVMRQFDFAVFISSCESADTRRRLLRSTCLRDLALLGVPYYFVIARPGQPSCIIDDVLYVDVADVPECCALKIGEAMAFSIEFMNLDYIFKIDDAAVVDPFKLLRCRYQDADFTAGGLIDDNTPPTVDFDNPQLAALRDAPSRIVRPVDGSLGYFLSLKARTHLAASGDVLRQCLADGSGVTLALREAGIVPVTPFGRFRAQHWSRPGPLCGGDVVLVAGVPAEAVENLYERLVGRDAYERERRANEAQIAVNFDWADLTLPAAPGSAHAPPSAAVLRSDRAARRG